MRIAVTSFIYNRYRRILIIQTYINTFTVVMQSTPASWRILRICINSAITNDYVYPQIWLRFRCGEKHGPADASEIEQFKFFLGKYVCPLAFHEVNRMTVPYTRILLASGLLTLRKGICFVPGPLDSRAC